MWVIIYGTTIVATKGLSRSLEYSSYRDNIGVIYGCMGMYVKVYGLGYCIPTDIYMKPHKPTFERG